MSCLAPEQETAIEQSATPYDDAAPADSLADSVLVMLTLVIVQRLIGFGRGVIFCRWLNPEQLGQWDLALGFLSLAAPVAVWGIPGSFGRYVEHYRQRGQLRMFLRRTLTVCAVLTGMAVALLSLRPRWISEVIFGVPDQARLVWLITASLAAVIAFNLLSDLFTALRRFRMVSLLQFVQGLLFALLGLGLLLNWTQTASGVVAAYGGSCLIAVLLFSARLRAIWKRLPTENVIQPHRALWGKLMPFAIWVWVTNWLWNLFVLVDRYMIIHYSGLDHAEALVQVGNYHSSRVVPLLMFSVATMLASVLLPHLSHDWESGRRKEVSDRLNLAIKLLGLGLTAAAVFILLVGPWLFEVAFAGKYSGGLQILPYTLMYCVWLGMAGVATNYLWCSERASLGSLAVLVGLIVNVALSIILLPRYGLMGAVLATAAANLAMLTLTYACSEWLGMRTDLGKWAITALPLALCLGAIPSLALVCVVALAFVSTDWFLSTSDKTELLAVARRYLGRLTALSGSSRLADVR